MTKNIPHPQVKNNTFKMKGVPTNTSLVRLINPHFDKNYNPNYQNHELKEILRITEELRGKIRDFNNYSRNKIYSLFEKIEEQFEKYEIKYGTSEKIRTAITPVKAGLQLLQKNYSEDKKIRIYEILNKSVDKMYNSLGEKSKPDNNKIISNVENEGSVIYLNDSYKNKDQKSKDIKKDKTKSLKIMSKTNQSRQDIKLEDIFETVKEFHDAKSSKGSEGVYSQYINLSRYNENSETIREQITPIIVGLQLLQKNYSEDKKSRIYEIVKESIGKFYETLNKNSDPKYKIA